MPDAQKPSIGRIVHYWCDIDRPLAAIVIDTIAEDDRLASAAHVNLHVFNRISRLDGEVANVPFSAFPTPGVDRWCWPPRV
jgi:hypothetical protein